MQKGVKVDKGKGKNEHPYVLQIDKYHRKPALYFRNKDGNKHLKYIKFGCPKR